MWRRKSEISQSLMWLHGATACFIQKAILKLKKQDRMVAVSIEVSILRDCITDLD